MKRFAHVFCFLFCLCLPLVFVACGEKPTYTIEVDVVTGGTIRVSNLYVAAGETVDVEVIPDNGYKFDHLSLDGDVLPSNSFVMPKKDVVLSGYFTKYTYSITYHLAADEVNNPANPSTYDVETQTFELMEPTKLGYTFIGWYKNEQRTTRISYVSKGSYGNLDLYPKWEKTTYVITYSLDGGTNDPANPQAFFCDDGIIELRPAAKDGFAFLGWFDNPTFSGSPTTSINPRTYKNYHLYAKFASTSLDEDGYRIITNRTDFLEILTNRNNWSPSSKLRLVADLDLTGIEWSPAGDSATPFEGEFDGNNHRIDNITIKNAYNYCGLFGFVNGATIKNLKITCNYAVSVAFAVNEINIGGIAAKAGANPTTISNCSVLPIGNQPSRIELTAKAENVWAGGIIGHAESATQITNCSVVNTSILVNATANAYIGGISGMGGSLSKCKYEDNVGTYIRANIAESTAYVGGLMGFSNNSRISNCYYSAEGSKLWLKGTTGTSATIHAGGLVGRLTNANSKIEYCYANLGTIAIEGAAANSELCVGGMFGSLENCTAEGCFVKSGAQAENIAVNLGTGSDALSQTKVGYAIGNRQDGTTIIQGSCFADIALKVFVQGQKSAPTTNEQDRFGIVSIEYILSYVQSSYDPSVWQLSPTGTPTF